MLITSQSVLSPYLESAAPVDQPHPPLILHLSPSRFSPAFSFQLQIHSRAFDCSVIPDVRLLQQLEALADLLPEHEESLVTVRQLVLPEHAETFPSAALRSP